MMSKDEILKIAKLAKLSVDDKEIEQLTLDMGKIIEYVNEINSVEDADENEDFDNINSIENSFNEDLVIESFDREEILKNREGGENGYFVVRKSLRR